MDKIGMKSSSGGHASADKTGVMSSSGVHASADKVGLKSSSGGHASADRSSTTRSSSVSHPSTDRNVTTSTSLSLGPGQPGEDIMPMKLVATMDIDNTGPSCVPRLCTFQVTRVSFPHKRAPEAAGDLPVFILAVKMQGIRRVFRSNEIPLDKAVDVTFEFAYPHYLKPTGNKMEIMLQKRKRTKHRPVMGFKTVMGCKTVATGCVDMAQILQRPLQEGQKLHLLSGGKDGAEAELVVGNLASQPQEDDMDDDDDGGGGVSGGVGSAAAPRGRSRTRRRRKSSTSKLLAPVDRSPDVDNNSEDDEFLDDDDLDDADAASDSDGGGGGGVGNAEDEARRNVKMRSSSNLKQRFAALLKKFMVNEEVVLEGVDQVDPEHMKKQEIEDIFNELEDCYPSDSDPEEDEISIMSVLSTPRPTLRPFFSEGSGSSRSQDILPVASPARKSSNSGDPTKSLSGNVTGD